MHRSGFQLRITAMRVPQKSGHNIAVPSTNGFRGYLLNNHLKHIVLKCDKNKEALTNNEMDHLIRTACNFLFGLHGSKPTVPERKLFAKSIHDQFLQLDSKLLYKKITQRMSNIQRRTSKKRNKERNQVKAEKVKSNGKTDVNESQNDASSVRDATKKVESNGTIDGNESQNYPSSDNACGDDYDELVTPCSIGKCVYGIFKELTEE